MNRYDVLTSSGYSIPVQRSDGRWVKYTDYEAAQHRIDEMQTYIDSLEQQLVEGKKHADLWRTGYKD